MEKKQTAVEWFFEQLEKDNHLTENEFLRIIQQAKEMDKEHHKKTWSEGMFCETGDIQAFEEYYNNNFKSK
jgi:hypothetical protein